jgi:CRP-like cAMP-binding protein
MISLIAVMGSGATIETMTIGRAGILGVMAGFGARRGIGRAIVQIEGEAARVPASHFQLAARESAAIRDLVASYNNLMLAQIQQCAACNAMHPLTGRLCRWLLQTHDLVDGDAIPLTQELLGQMLGVRRTTLTVVARLLQTSGMIQYRRGLIHIVDRRKLEQASCECYGVIKQHTDMLFPMLRGNIPAVT